MEMERGQREGDKRERGKGEGNKSLNGTPSPVSSLEHVAASR